MKKLKIGFVMDPPEKLDLATDSSFFLIKEGLKRGHNIFYIPDTKLFMENGQAFCHSYKPKIATPNTVNLLSEKLENLRNFDALLIRKDPPFNMDYIYMTYILETVENEVLCINKPSSIRSANEKFYSQKFAHSIPDTLITKNPSQIIQFLGKYKKGIVVKPLDQKGGSGVFYINQKDVNKNEIIKTITENGKHFIVAQEYLPGILKHGDKRVTMLKGKPINALLRVPKKGDFRGNISSGATGVKSKISPVELKICTKLGEEFSKQGLNFVGLDFIDEKVTEINTTSPILGFDIFPENGKKVYEMLEKMLS